MRASEEAASCCSTLSMSAKDRFAESASRKFFILVFMLRLPHPARLTIKKYQRIYIYGYCFVRSPRCSGTAAISCEAAHSQSAQDDIEDDAGGDCRKRGAFQLHVGPVPRFHAGFLSAIPLFHCS